MPGTVKSELLTYADRSHKCDSQEKVCWMLYLPLDKSHFITGFCRIEEIISHFRCFPQYFYGGIFFRGTPVGVTEAHAAKANRVYV